MQDYIRQHDDSNPFIARRRVQVLAERRQAAAAYLAKVDQETVASIARENREAAAATRKHLKVVR